MANGNAKRWTGQQIEELRTEISSLKADPRTRQHARDEALELLRQDIKAAIDRGIPPAEIREVLSASGLKVGHAKLLSMIEGPPKSRFAVRSKGPEDTRRRLAATGDQAETGNSPPPIGR